MKSIWKINMKSMWHQCFLVTWMKGASIIQSSTEQHTLLRMRKRQKKEYKMMNGFLGPFVEDRTHTWRFLLGASINNVDIILGDFWPTPGSPPPSLTSLPHKLIYYRWDFGDSPSSFANQRSLWMTLGLIGLNVLSPWYGVVVKLKGLFCTIHENFRKLSVT